MTHRNRHSIAAALRFDRGQMFLAALLLALASALVPALFPAGSALAGGAGSAFDPTTSTVTLRARDGAERTIIITEPNEDDEHERASPLSPAIPATRPAQAPLAGRLRADPRPADGTTPMVALQPFAQARPRAPPAHHP